MEKIKRGNEKMILLVVFLFVVWLLYQIIRFMKGMKVHNYSSLESQIELVEYMKENKEEKK